MNDEVHMSRALALAAAAGKAGEAPIGCVIVDETGAVIAEGANAPIALHDPTAHAEIVALRKAAGILQNYRLKPNLTLYVTLEPCAMCAGACVLGRIDRLVFGADDPKAGMCGSLENLVQDTRLNHRVEVVRGVRAEECGELLREFFRARR